MKPPCNLAVECARSIMNYCLTRFPTDTPPHDMLDLPWFAEKVQKAIDDCTTEIARLKAGLDMISQLLSDRVPCMIARATLDGADLLDEETAIKVCEGHWKAEEEEEDLQMFRLKMIEDDEYPLQIINRKTGEIKGRYRGTSRGSAINHLNRLNKEK